MKKTPLAILSTIALLSSCNKGGAVSSSFSSSSETSSFSSSLSFSSSESSSSSSSSSSSISSSSSNSSLEPQYLYNPEADDHLQVFALEMTGNYGDSTLFKYGNFEILIDGGSYTSSSTVKEALISHVEDHVLDMLILTHPHADHYGGMEMEVFNGASITSVKTIIDSGADTYSSSAYATYWVNGVRSHFISSGATYYPVKNLVDGTFPSTFNITEDLSITFLDTGNYTEPGGNGSDGNPTSVACSLRAGTYDFAMFGDLGSGEESDLISLNESSSFINEGDTVIFKADHHGSAGSNTSELMDYLCPTYAWCSSGITSASQTTSGPKSQHPYISARNRIEAKTGKENLYWNGTMGTIDMSLDSSFSNFEIHGEGRKAAVYYTSSGVKVDASSEKDTPLEDTEWAKSGA